MKMIRKEMLNKQRAYGTETSTEKRSERKIKGRKRNKVSKLTEQFFDLARHEEGA